MYKNPKRASYIREKKFTNNLTLSFGFERYDKFVLVELKVVLLNSNMKKVLTKIIYKFLF